MNNNDLRPSRHLIRVRVYDDSSLSCNQGDGDEGQETGWQVGRAHSGCHRPHRDRTAQQRRFHWPAKTSTLKNGLKRKQGGV